MRAYVPVMAVRPVWALAMEPGLALALALVLALASALLARNCASKACPGANWSESFPTKARPARDAAEWRRSWTTTKDLHH